MAEIWADWQIDDPTTLTDSQRQSIINQAKLIAGIGAAFAGEDVNAAADMAATAVKYNSLKVISSIGRALVKSLDELNAIRKSGKTINISDFTELLKKQGKDELLGIADDIFTIFNGDANYVDKILAAVDLASGLDFNKSKGEAANLLKDAQALRRHSEIASNVIKANKYKPADHIIKQASQNAIEMAKGGKIDKVDELVAKFGGDRNSWKKMKGKDSQGREWHWYTRGDGSKIGWKIKGVHLHDPF